MTESFGAALKRYREHARVSQSRLGEWAGFDHSYVSRLESGARRPTREAVGLLADALGLPAAHRDALLESAGFLSERDPEVERFRALPPELRREVLDFIEKVRGAA